MTSVTLVGKVAAVPRAVRFMFSDEDSLLLDLECPVWQHTGGKPAYKINLPVVLNPALAAFYHRCQVKVGDIIAVMGVIMRVPSLSPNSKRRCTGVSAATIRLVAKARGAEVSDGHEPDVQPYG